MTEAHPDWALGFADGVWWSRVAQPHLHAWTVENQPLRLVEQAVAPDDPAPKALACYGVLLRPAAPSAAGRRGLVALRGRASRQRHYHPVLDWCCSQLAAQGIAVWALIWDNASWQVSKAVRDWIRAHNHAHNYAVKRQGHGVRLLVCRLPVKRPWLNPIEPKWVHSKRAIVEPTRLLSAQEVADRVCSYLGCPHEPHLSLPDPILDKAN